MFSSAGWVLSCFDKSGRECETLSRLNRIFKGWKKFIPVYDKVRITVFPLGDSATLGDATEGSGEGSLNEWDAVKADRFVALTALFSMIFVLRFEINGFGSGEGGGVALITGVTWGEDDTCGVVTRGAVTGGAPIWGDTFLGDGRDGLPLRFGDLFRIEIGLDRWLNGYYSDYDR